MIKFFRHIRKSLLMENKTGKYFKYAIGEIILVMIGILLALQVNNWNENRISRTKEKLLLKELNAEFLSNKAQLDSVLYFHKRSLKAVQNIMSMFPINDLTTINIDSLSKNIYYSGWTYTFNPSQGITNSLLNSSSFDLISNDTLRNLLIRWNDVVTDYQEEEMRAYNNYNSFLKPYEKKHIIYHNDYRLMLNDPRLDLEFLKTIEFENYVRDRYNDVNDIVNNGAGEIEMVTNTIDKIIALSIPKDND
jgi:hypothetical protein